MSDNATSLRQRLAEAGFETTANFSYRWQVFHEPSRAGVRCLNVIGEGRRKTAFATALAQAVEFDHMVYTDLSARPPPGDDIPPLDRATMEACAYAESAATALSIDQLQAAPFSDHLRLSESLESLSWSMGNEQIAVNPERLTLMLISEEPLYHSLARHCFRIHAGAPIGRLEMTAEHLGLESSAQPLLAAMADWFELLSVTPTESEYRHLVHDLVYHARSAAQLRESAYGWVENIDHDALHAATSRKMSQQVIDNAQVLFAIETIEWPSVGD